MKAPKINHKLSLNLSFLLLIIFTSGIAIAGITTTGETSPAYDSSVPWILTDGLTVGIDSNGTMIISDGSSVSSSTGYIAGFLVGTGNTTITDSNSLWEISDNLYVGYGGSGNLTVSNGGRVSDSNGYAGYKANSTANVEISGSGSLWQNSGDLYLGYSGTADVLVSNGGSITNVNGYIGYHSGHGAVTVTGAGSLWENSGDLYIADRGFAELIISDGAKVTNNRAFIGYNGPPELLDRGLDFIENELMVGFAPKSDGNMPSTEEKNAILASLGGGTVVRESSSYTLVELPDNVFVNPDIIRTYNNSPEILYAEPKYYAYITVWLGVQEGPASVTVTGTGSLWENADTLYIGGNQIESKREATLTISDGGIVQASDVVVWEQGIITGDSVLRANTITNKGTIRPGNSIGTLTIDGDLIMQAGSTLEIEVDNSGNNDKLIATGSTNIEGGTVKAIPTETITNEQEYTIVEAESITGVFDGLDTSMLSTYSTVYLCSELSYETDAIKLLLSALNFDDSSIVSSDNQKSVGSALQVIADGGGNAITTGLQQLTNIGEVRNAYDQLCGQTRTSLASVSAMSNTSFIDTVSNRLYSTQSVFSDKSNNSPLFAMAQPDNGTNIYDTDTSINSFALGNGTNYYASEQWGLWGRGYGVFGDRETHGEIPGYQYRVYGTGFGMDYKFSGNLMLGITGGYSYGHVDYFSSRDKSDIYSTPIGIYGSWNTKGGYIDSIVDYAPMEYETRRYVDLTSETLKGKFDGYETGASIEAGRNWFYGKDFLIQPMASFQFSYLNLESYIETGGASALSFDDQSYNSYKGSLGMKAKKQFWNDTRDRSLIIELRGRWSHEFGDTESNINANFAGNPGAIFKVSDEGLPRDSTVLGIGLKQIEKQNTMYYIDYDTSLNAEDISHIISAGLRYRW